MSIRDTGYKPYDGQHTPMAGRWAVVLKRSLRMSAKQGGVIAILICALFPALAWAVWMYIDAKTWMMMPGGQAEAAGMYDPSLIPYRFLFSYKGAPVFAFLMALFAGGGAVADDFRQGTFQFYFARPISREQYLAGKAVPVVMLVAFVSLAPALLLAIMRVAIARDGADVAHSLLLLLQTSLMGIIEAIVIAVPVVALSSVSKGRGYAQGAFAAFFMLPWIVGSVFVAITRTPWPALLSIPDLLQSLGAKIFGYEIPTEERAIPWLAAAVASVALVTGSVLLLRRRLAAAEVVAG
jgi:ABC-type transport system involved in multi-copper enzyme maturation permease subunit